MRTLSRRPVGATRAAGAMASDGRTARSGRSRRDADREPESPRPVEVTVRPVFEEPTWEVYRPGIVRRRLDRRTRSVLGAAVAAAIAANAGVVWAYWKVNGSPAGGSPTGTPVQVVLRGRSDADRPLTPGGTGNLTVTLTNDNDFPVRITAVTRAAGTVLADPRHRDAGCTDASIVSMTRATFPVSWEVASNTVGAFTVPDALTRSRTRSPACDGAAFSVPIRAVGVSG